MIGKHKAEEMFIACCAAIGYLHDSARGKLANEIQNDVRGWYELVGASPKEREEVLLGMLAQGHNAWVRLYCVTLLGGKFPELQMQVLAECQTQGGAVAVLADVWLRDGMQAGRTEAVSSDKSKIQSKIRQSKSSGSN